MRLEILMVLVMIIRTSNCQLKRRTHEFGIAPLRSGSMSTPPITNRFVARSAPQFEVLPSVDAIPDNGETWHEGTLDLSSRLATRLAWKGFEEDVNERIETEMMWVPIKVLSGHGQVVYGVLYDLRVLAGTSNCSRFEINSHTLQENHCVHYRGPQRAIFRVLVSEKSTLWNPFIPDTSRVFSTKERNVEELEEF
ncbi:unnamed protein product [Caenorhabditis bovis]|uniref:Cystatin domain-containing protein n=1 Tax=Caenorhabditis bovis TaxID=2654633 RepID=A0A8S1EL96_9PELO|nr:unnamed protein product [Caenorhabditis bovis]